MEKKLNNIKYLISKNKIPVAITELKTLCVSTGDEYNINQVILIESKYNRLQEDKMSDILSQDLYYRSLATLRKSILELCDYIANKYMTKNIIERSIDKSNSIFDQLDIVSNRIDDERIKIAIAGYPNVGKTTLMRNIFRSDVGVIEDASNVTLESYLMDKEELGISFIDCPGFNEAGRVLDLFELIGNDKDLKEALLKRNLKEDYNALLGVKSADVIYYVVSVMRTPNKGDDSALHLIKKFNKKIIGIVNMAHTIAEQDKDKSNNRVELWKDFFRQNEVGQYEVYDFFWDKPTKIHKIYLKTIDFLPREKQPNLIKKYERVIQKYEKGCLELAKSIKDMINECKKIEYQLVIQGSMSETVKEQKVKSIENKVLIDILNLMQPPLQKISLLYGLKATNSSLDDNFSKKETTIKSEIDDKFGNAVAGGLTSGIFGGLGALQGILMGLGTAAAGPFVLLFIAVGSIVGWNLSTESTKKIEIKLNEEHLMKILKQIIGMFWIASNQGYGKNSKIDNSELSNLALDEGGKLLSRFGFSTSDIYRKEGVQKIEDLVIHLAKM